MGSEWMDEEQIASSSIKVRKEGRKRERVEERKKEEERVGGVERGEGRRNSVREGPGQMQHLGCKQTNK